MSKTVLPRPIVIDAKRAFIIVASQFNAQYVEGLVEHAKQELRALAPNAAISVQRVPGAFEIPVVLRELASQAKADVLIACGVILKGKTDHAQNLSRSVTDALQHISIGHGVPLTNAALRFHNATHSRDPRIGN